MAAKNVGTLIREARTSKKLSQEQLAGGIEGLSGNDIGKAERGEKELSQTQLKAIAKALGITQKSLLEAPKGGAAATAAKAAAETGKTASKTTAAKTTAAAKKTTTAAKTTSAKTATAAKKTTAAAKTATAAKKTTTAKTATAAKKTTTAKKPAAAAKAPSSTTALSAAEKKLIELYRTAESDNKKLATRILKGDKLELGDVLPMLMSSGAIGEDGLLGSLLGKMQGLVK